LAERFAVYNPLTEL
jgi:hypothetical protein